MTKSAMCLTTDKLEEICQLLIEFEFWKVIWIASWIYRFFENCKDKRKLSVPLKRNATEKAKMFWIKYEQVKIETTDHFKEDQGQPKLQKNGTGIFECKGSSQENNAWGSHILTMAAIRGNYWIPKLKQIARRVIRNCFG